MIRLALRRLADDRRGAVTLMFALSASLMIGALSMGIDLIRYEISQARLQAALDAANLSASVDMGHYGTNGCPTGGTTAWQADALAYYNVNMPSDYLNLWTTNNSNFTATCTTSSTGGQLVQLSASGSLPLVAPSFLAGNNTVTSGSGSSTSGSNVMQVSAVDQVLRTPQTKLELALVLDNTGSMADPPNDNGYQASSYSGSKMYGLKTAALSLLSNLFSQNSSTYYIGVVPFASTVNVKGSLNSTGAWLQRAYNFNPGSLPATTPDSTFNGYTGSTNGPVSTLYGGSGSTLIGDWSWTTTSSDILSGSYLSGTSKSPTQAGTYASGSATSTAGPTGTWTWSTVGAPTALPTGSGWWSWANSGWGGCVAEPRDSNGNLQPLAYSASGLQGQFTPYYYNAWPAGTWTATVTVPSNTAGVPAGSVQVTSAAATGPGMAAWAGTASGTMQMQQSSTTTTVAHTTDSNGHAITTTTVTGTVSWQWTPSQTLTVSAGTLQTSEAALSSWPQSNTYGALFSGSYTLTPTTTTTSGWTGNAGTTTSSNNNNSYYNNYNNSNQTSFSTSSLTWTWQSAAASSQTSTVNSTNSQTTQNYMCIGTPVMFLTNNQSALTGEIDAMQPAGDTVIPLGLLWGWRMLSSSWSNAVAGNGNGWNQSSATSGSVSLPLPETTTGLQRVIILMTDGVNSIGAPTTTFNGLSGVGTDSLGTTATGSYATTSGTNGVSNIDAYQQQVCTAIKQQGITIYTIAFGTGAQANTALQSCASPGDFFYASDNTALNTVFQQIATNIGILQLVK